MRVSSKQTDFSQQLTSIYIYYKTECILLSNACAVNFLEWIIPDSWFLNIGVIDICLLRLQYHDGDRGRTLNVH